MADEFAEYTTGLSSPAAHVVEITPNDSADLTTATRALLIGVEGNVKITTAGAETVIVPVVKGYNPLRVVRVWSTSTTATGIFGLY